MSPQQALDLALAGSPLTAQIDGGRVFVRGRASSESRHENQASDAEILVTGSRIRGAKVASPVITMTADSIAAAGQATVGEAVRSLPQNFGGGQNPGVAGGGDQGGNHNINSSSTINLRGLGPDATLTLINGHRVAYDSFVQGIDVDQIPLAALDRIEIVADGASALYGSDAVGGVANIILKRDFQGIAVSTRLGTSTDGGGEMGQYGLTAGQIWSSGGVMGAFSLRRSAAIDADDRSFTRTLGPDATLLPQQRQYGGVVSGHQDLGGSVHFDLDAIYNHRTSLISFPTSATGNVMADGNISSTREESWSVSPKFRWDVGRGWLISTLGAYGADETDGQNKAFSASRLSLSGRFGYHDQMLAAEANAEGPLVALPGGDARLALGGGYRTNRLTTTTATDTPGAAETANRTSASRRSYYGFAELNLPIVSARNHLPAVHALSASAAVRYEDYPGSARLATPKFGIIYAPTDELSFKGSWGKSFKAPTLYQEQQVDTAVILPASSLGAVGAPAGATAIFYSGGNPNLKPETATSWSATAEFRSRLIPNFSMQASYFHILYRHRIVDPITSSLGVLSNPVYQDLITFQPSATYVADVLASSAGNVLNFGGSPISAANILAVIDDRVLNVARQIIHGIDLDSRYETGLGGYGKLQLAAAASYLKSTQRRSALQPSQALAGVIFEPPHWRAHGAMTWVYGDFQTSANLTWIGGVTDNRMLPTYRVRGMAPVDLALRYHVRSHRRAFDGIDLTVAVQDVQNVKPAQIHNSTLFDPTFDSTNYSAIGRFISFTIARTL